MKKIIVLKTLAAFFYITLLVSCGNSGGSGLSASLPNDNFNYSSFPAAPWSVYDTSVTTTADWTMLSPGVQYNGTSASPTNYAALVNDNYSSGFDSSVIAHMKVNNSNAEMELLLRASVTGSNPNYYQLLINTATKKISILKIFNGVSHDLVTHLQGDFPVSFDPGIYHTYKFSITGSGTSTVTLRGFIDGAQFVSDTDNGIVFNAILATGKTGFGFINTSNGAIASFQVTEP